MEDGGQWRGGEFATARTTAFDWCASDQSPFLAFLLLAACYYGQRRRFAIYKFWSQLQKTTLFRIVKKILMFFFSRKIIPMIHHFSAQLFKQGVFLDNLLKILNYMGFWLMKNTKTFLTIQNNKNVLNANNHKFCYSSFSNTTLKNNSWQNYLNEEWLFKV